MTDNKETGFGSIPDGMSNNSEKPLASKPEVNVPVEKSLLGNFISGEGIIFNERPLQNGDKEQGVVRDTSIHGTEYLIFDPEQISKKEQALIREFLEKVKDKGKIGLEGSAFYWFFEEETDQFIQDLAKRLETRLSDLDAGDTDALASQKLGKEDNLFKAAQSFREMAKRKQIREAIDKQIPHLPFKGFQARKQDGSIVDIPFNAQAIVDGTSPIEFIYVQNFSGNAELFITCNNTEYTAIRPVYFTDEEQEKNPNSFQRVEGTGMQKVVASDPRSGRDMSSYEVDIKRGRSDVDPLFTKIRILSSPVDLDKELDEYAKQKAKEEEQKKKQAPKPSTSNYAPPLPSIPSTPRHSQPTGYVRSG